MSSPLSGKGRTTERDCEGTAMSCSCDACREKWNTTGETGNECRENEVPAEGSGDGMRLSQKPFQAYAASRDHDDRRRSRSLRELA